MAKEKIFYVVGKHQYKVRIKVRVYINNGNMFIGLVSDNRAQESFADITVNLDHIMAPFQACINNYGPGQEDAIDFLERYGLATPTGQIFDSGFVSVPVYQFDMEKLKELDPQGVENYLKVIERRKAEK